MFVVCYTGDPPPRKVADVVFLPLGDGDPVARLAGLRPDGFLVNDPGWEPPYLSDRLLDAAPGLRIVTYMGGTMTVEDYADVFDFGALRSRGIVVTTTTGSAISVAEGTMTLLTALNYGLMSRPSHRETLHGSTLGIVGMGQVARRVAELASAFGMTVLYNSRREHPEVAGAAFLPLPDLMAASQHVSVHASSSLARGLIDRQALSRAMAINLVNTAHPAIIEPAALLDALADGRVRHVAMEGGYPSPYRERLASLPAGQVLQLPAYTSWDTTDARERAWDAYVASLRALLDGQVVPYRLG